MAGVLKVGRFGNSTPLVHGYGRVTGGQAGCYKRQLESVCIIKIIMEILNGARGIILVRRGICIYNDIGEKEAIPCYYAVRKRNRIRVNWNRLLFCAGNLASPI